MRPVVRWDEDVSVPELTDLGGSSGGRDGELPPISPPRDPSELLPSGPPPRLGLGRV